MSDPSTIVENRDSLEHLEASGFAKLIAALQEPSVYTTRGRVIVAEIARLLGISPRRAAAMLLEARKSLQ